jgi:ribonuclease HI
MLFDFFFACSEWKTKHVNNQSIPLINGHILSLFLGGEESIKNTMNSDKTKSLEDKILDGDAKNRSKMKTNQRMDFVLYCNVLATLKRLHNEQQMETDSDSTTIDPTVESAWRNLEFLQNLFGIPTNPITNQQRILHNRNVNSENESVTSRVQRSMNIEERIQNELQRHLQSGELFLLEKSFEFTSHNTKLGPTITLEQTWKFSNIKMEYDMLC